MTIGSTIGQPWPTVSSASPTSSPCCSDRRPLTLEEIVERVPGYPAERESYRRQFERDKATLREIGCPSRSRRSTPSTRRSGYRIHRADYELPALDLTDDERVALHLAVTAVRLEAGSVGSRPALPAGDALLKLGGPRGRGRPDAGRPPRRARAAGAVRRLSPPGPGHVLLPGRVAPARPVRDPASATATGTSSGSTPTATPSGPSGPTGSSPGSKPGRTGLRAARRVRARLGAARRAVALRRRGAGRGPGARIGDPGGLGRGRSRRAGGGRAARPTVRSW